MNAWAELGAELDGCITAEDSMKAGLLAGWNVRKVPMFATLPAVKGISRQVEVTDRVAVVRDNPRTARQVDYLSIVSPRYHVVANEAYGEVLDQLAEESGSTFAHAGEIDGGRCAFLTMRLPGQLHGGVEVYIAAINDHGGYKPFTLLATPVHLASGSVLAAIEIGRVRHSPGALAAAEQVTRSALDTAFTALDELQTTVDRLASTSVSQPQFEQILERHFGAPLGAPRATQTRGQARVDDIADLFSEADDSTAWAAFLALADWYDHRSAVRGETSRAYKAIFDTGFKDDALRVMKGLT